MIPYRPARVGLSTADVAGKMHARRVPYPVSGQVRAVRVAEGKQSIRITRRQTADRHRWKRPVFARDQRLELIGHGAQFVHGHDNGIAVELGALLLRSLMADVQQRLLSTSARSIKLVCKGAQLSDQRLLIRRGQVGTVRIWR